MAGLSARLGIVDWTGAVQLGLAMWIGFRVVLLTGSIVWENVPPKLAAIHSGDWLLKLLVIAVIVTVSRQDFSRGRSIARDEGAGSPRVRWHNGARAP